MTLLTFLTLPTREKNTVIIHVYISGQNKGSKVIMA